MAVPRQGKPSMAGALPSQGKASQARPVPIQGKASQARPVTCPCQANMPSQARPVPCPMPCQGKPRKDKASTAGGALPRQGKASTAGALSMPCHAKPSPMPRQTKQRPVPFHAMPRQAKHGRCLVHAKPSTSGAFPCQAKHDRYLVHALPRQAKHGRCLVHAKASQARPVPCPCQGKPSLVHALPCQCMPSTTGALPRQAKHGRCIVCLALPRQAKHGRQAMPSQARSPGALSCPNNTLGMPWPYTGQAKNGQVPCPARWPSIRNALAGKAHVMDFRLFMKNPRPKNEMLLLRDHLLMFVRPDAKFRAKPTPFDRVTSVKAPEVVPAPPAPAPGITPNPKTGVFSWEPSNICSWGLTQSFVSNRHRLIG